MSMAQAVSFFGRSLLGRPLAHLLSPGVKDAIKTWAGIPPAPAEDPAPTPPPETSPPPPPELGKEDVISQHWDQQASEAFVRDMTRRSWSGIAQTHLNHNYLITGRRDYYWVRYLRDQYFPSGNAGHALSLGCGEGHVDRIWKGEGLEFRSFTGIDISPASVQRAQELADQMQLSPRTRYYSADLNQFELLPRQFDFIYFFQSLHHIESLEALLASCAKALRPGGWLMVNEFVGPTRFQWTEQQLALANQLLNWLPPSLRVDLLYGDGRLKTKCVTHTVEEMIIGDPSEAVRSADIERVLKDHFDVVEEKNWGGTLNYLVFENIAGNFDPDNPVHECIVEFLIQHENQLIAQGVIPSDFKFYMARPKAA